jgi:hypothetical protein
MKSGLAEKILAKTMNWTAEETSRQRPLLQALANFKYNEYQQFSPGTRFIESLVKWLSQFETEEEKRTAYQFVLDSLIFISSNQIAHLVNITYADKIQPIVIAKTASIIKLNPFWVNKIVKSTTYKVNLRKSLFIGLSDGSKIDLLRRSTPRISNEQVLTTYSISKEKREDMLNELKNEKINSKFNTIFLIDDFTASGTSYFRKSRGEWKGKIYKFLQSILPKGENASLRQEDEPLDINIIFYLATFEALEKLKENIQIYKSEHPDSNFKFTIDAVQIIGSEIKTEILSKTAFINLIKKYFDESIVDRHYKEGKHDEPYLGFNECCLPIILNHNTPNNSLPILWFPDDKIIGLFPRVKRHKDE